MRLFVTPSRWNKFLAMVSGQVYIPEINAFMLTSALAPVLFFWVTDSLLFGSCLVKFLQGGWFPILVALCFMTIMATWWDGWKLLAAKVFKMRPPMDRFIGRIVREKPVRYRAPGYFSPPSGKISPPCSCFSDPLRGRWRRWQRLLFRFMYRNAVSPVVFYSIPPEDVLELGIQVEF